MAQSVATKLVSLEPYKKKETFGKYELNKIYLGYSTSERDMALNVDCDLPAKNCNITARNSVDRTKLYFRKKIAARARKFSLNCVRHCLGQASESY